METIGNCQTGTVGVLLDKHMGGGSCQKSYGPFLGTLHNRCRILKGDPKRDHQFDNHSYVYIYIYKCIYVCMYVCMYVYIYIYTYTYIYI